MNKKTKALILGLGGWIVRAPPEEVVVVVVV